MIEKPNLIYLEHISDGDPWVRQRLWIALRQEFEEETEKYHINMKANNYNEAALQVYNLRHKVGFFGMENAYKLCKQFEHNLKVDSEICKNEFEIILATIQKFVTKNHTYEMSYRR